MNEMVEGWQEMKNDERVAWVLDACGMHKWQWEE